jgi:hypothetical protein
MSKPLSYTKATGMARREYAKCITFSFPKGEKGRLAVLKWR